MEKSSGKYEEASSPSDSSSSSDEEEMRGRQQQVDSSSEDDYSSSDSDSNSSSSDGSNVEKIDDEGSSDDGSHASEENDIGTPDNDASSDDDEDMPLYERIRKKEEQGVNLRKARQRKSEALQVASQRLASFKEKKKRAAAGENDSDDDNHARQKKKKKKSKHRPTEVSSKRADYFKRGAPKLNESGVGVEIGAKRYKPLDPRASSLSGHFNEEQFQKNYAFLDEIRNQEIGQVRKRIAAYKAAGDKGKRMRRKLGLDGSDPNGLEEEQARLRELTQQRADTERRTIERVAQQNVKRKLKEGVESGKHGAYFLKRKEKKQLEYEEKIKEIEKRKGSKAVEKILEKKRRREKSRDAKTFKKFS